MLLEDTFIWWLQNKGFPMYELVGQRPLPLNTYRMPVDLSSYLLASSPPASNFDLLSFTLNAENANNRVNTSQGGNGFVPQTRLQRLKQKYPIKSIIIKSNLNECGNECDETRSGDESCPSSGPSSGRQSPVSPCSPGKSRKKVSFADHKGMALATVKIMTEPSDVPPVLGPEIISSLTKGASANGIGEPPLQLKFPQPASDYLAFREKLERDCVSLENVILKDYLVMGTVKVKNMDFHKRVFVRCTFDSWESVHDIEGKFASGSGQNGGCFDTFSFEFEVPTRFDKDKKIEFAICFDCSGKQYWDNNNGVNYQIACSDFSHSQPDSSKVDTGHQSLEKNASWTEYASWNHVDASTPYW